MRWPSGLRVCRWWKERYAVKQREKQAQRELDESRRMLEEDRKRLVYRLATEHQRNQFSDMIRDALEAGYEPRKERREGA